MSVSSPTKSIFPKDFNTICIEKTESRVILRAAILSPEDAEKWKEKFSCLTRTDWIVQYVRKNHERFTMHKKWHCQFSQLKKTANSVRSTDCKVKLDLKIRLITDNTKKKDPHIRGIGDGICRPTEIRIEGIHNHHLESADTLRFNRVSKDLSQTFCSYFDDGLSPANARKLHEDKLIAEDNFLDLADNKQNPSRRCTHYIYDKWSNLQFGPQNSNPITKIREKLIAGDYQAKGVDVYLEEKDGDWAILLVTPFHRRVQNELFAQEILYVDSTSHLDVTHCTLTSLTVASKAGALPIGVLLHSGQSETCYTLAFQLFREQCPNAFGGEEAPMVIMTDDSAPERNSLSKVWPTSRLLLCLFHVLSKEWKWLLSNCRPNSRQKLMKLYYKVVYAEDVENFNAAKDEILQLRSSHGKFVTRFEKYLLRSCEWALHERCEVLLRNNHTNNYAESSIKIVKEAVLDRLKAFNPVALVEFLIGPMEAYYKRRILDHAHNRHSAHSVVFHKLLARVDKIKPEQIKKIDDNLYHVPSAKDDGIVYEVFTDIGLCTCKAGEGGSFCKHQSLLVKHFSIQLPSAPPLLSSDRFSLAKIALGEKCPESSFFLGRQEIGESRDSPVGPNESSELVNRENDSMDVDMENDFTLDANENEASNERRMEDIEKEEEIKEIAASFEDLLQMAKSAASHELLTKLKRSLQKASTPSAATAALVSIYRNINNVCSKRGRIAVNPTGRARRRDGVSKGASRIPLGRPSKVSQKVSGPPKRRRNLSQAVKSNSANAKSH